MSKEELQNKYMQYQMIDQQMKQIQQQVQVIEKQLVDLAVTRQAMDDLEKTNVGSEILVPVSNGIFTKAELKDNKKLILNVGSNTAVEKSIPDTKKLIDNQFKEIKKVQKDLMKDLQNLAVQAQIIEKDLNALSH